MRDGKDQIEFENGVQVRLPRALDNVVSCWPQQRLLGIRLPEEEGEALIRLEKGAVEVGAFSKDPEAFAPISRFEVRGLLEPGWKPFGVKVILRARSWSFGATKVP